LSKSLRARWSTLTPEQRQEISVKVGIKSKGRWKSLSPERREASREKNRTVLVRFDIPSTMI
jgi:hypothetical protein